MTAVSPITPTSKSGSRKRTLFKQVKHATLDGAQLSSEEKKKVKMMFDWNSGVEVD